MVAPITIRLLKLEWLQRCYSWPSTGLRWIGYFNCQIVWYNVPNRLITNLFSYLFPLLQTELKYWPIISLASFFFATFLASQLSCQRSNSKLFISQSSLEPLPSTVAVERRVLLKLRRQNYNNRSNYVSQLCFREVWSSAWEPLKHWAHGL